MKKITLIFFGFLILFGSACKKITEGVNVDPNRPTDLDPYPLLLNGAEVSTILFMEGSLARLGGMWSRTFTGSDRQYSSLYNYETTSGDYDDNWDRLYGIVIANAQLVVKKATDVNDKTTIGIAQVIQAMGFGTAADVWGDVPFSEAGDPALHPTPKFDDQASVYAGVQALLDDAITNLRADVGAGPAEKDFLYGGDNAKWIAAANTLKARFYLHTKEYDKAIAAAAAGISVADDNLVAPHGDAYLSSFNIYYSFLSYDRVGYMNAVDSYAADLLDESRTSTYRGNAKTNENDRFNYLFQTGLNTGDLDPNVLVDFDWGTPTAQNGFFGATTFFPLVTYEENQLIIAEANMKQATADPNAAVVALNDLRAYYNIGGSTSSGTNVSSSPDYSGLGQLYLPYLLTDFAPGGILNPVTSGQTIDQALLREILTERYVTFIGQIEQFNDVRRTKNYLNIPPVKGTQLPQRFLYAQSEINTNPNTPALTIADLFKETPINTTPY